MNDATARQLFALLDMIQVSAIQGWLLYRDPGFLDVLIRAYTLRNGVLEQVALVNKGE